MYRDVWPYATVTLSPADAAEGPLVWVKLALLSIAAVVIPLTAPRKYEPINPKVLGFVCILSYYSHST